MQRCLQLAQLGQAFVSPNPMVGAVLVYKDMIIGEGWHQKYGEAHAEVHCINSVPEHLQHLISASTIYVSLEPCAHYGKTPPCAQLLIDNNIPKVVIGCQDPFNKVNGNGISMLKEAGIAVEVGVLEAECIALNKRFFTFHNKKRPYITLKWAQTSDHFIAPNDGSNYKISNSISHKLVHKMRTTEDAFLVGFNTVVQDNPKLNNRHWPTDKQPVRLLLDPNNALPCDRNVFDGSLNTLIFNKTFQMFGGETEWVKIESDDFLDGVMETLYQRNLTSIVVEGGTKTLQTFIDKGLFDEIYVFESKQNLGEGIPAPVLKNAKTLTQQQLQDNTLTIYQFT